MTITRDQALGQNSANGSATVAITTTQTAAAGSRIVVCFSFFASGGTLAPACSDSGGAYTLDERTDNGQDHFCVFSRVLGGSLASGQVITATMGASATGPGGALVTAVSYLGTTGVDTTSNNVTTGTGFSSGSATNSVADALFVGGAGNEAVATTVGGTNTNGTSQFDIYNVAAGQGLRMLDKIASTIGAQALTGTWASTSTATTGGLVIYKGTASAAAAPAFTPHRMPLGV